MYPAERRAPIIHRLQWRCKCELESVRRTFRPSSDLWLVVVRELQRDVFGGGRGHRRHGLYEYELIGYEAGTMRRLEPEDRIDPAKVYVVERRHLGPVDVRLLRRRPARVDPALATDEQSALYHAQDAADEWARHMGRVVRPPKRPTTDAFRGDGRYDYLDDARRSVRGVPLGMRADFLERSRPKILCDDLLERS